MPKRSNRKIDENVRVIEDGSQATLLLSFLADKLITLEASIIDELMLKYLHGTLTSEIARDRVAEIAGLRRLVKLLESSASKGIQAKKEEFSNG